MSTQAQSHTQSDLEQDIAPVDVTVSATETLDDSGGFPPIDPMSGSGGGQVCDWEGEVCTETPEYYVLQFCTDPDCPHSHRRPYCKRHYLLTIADIAKHLSQCDGYYDGMSQEDRRVLASGHIAGFGRLSD